MLPRCSMLRED